MLSAGRVAPIPWKLRPVGSASSRSRESTSRLVVVCTSTSGELPVTVTVSSTVPTFSSAFTLAVKFASRTIPACLTVWNPASSNVTSYVPGRRSTIRNWPEASETPVFDLSIRAGLLAVTVTPGRTAPLASMTTPAIALWAAAGADAMSIQIVAISDALSN